MSPADGEPDADETTQLTSPSPESTSKRELPRSVTYHLALTPAEVIEQFRQEQDLGVYMEDDLPDWADGRAKHRFTMEVEEDAFKLHVGPPAARGQSGTGLLRLLYLAGTTERTPEGSRVDLRFVYARPRWAGQRRLGFVALLLAAAFWVSVGGGELYQRLLFFLGFVAVTMPVVVHDLRRGKRLEREKLDLLALMERMLGPLSLDRADRTPYRKRDAKALGGS